MGLNKTDSPRIASLSSPPLPALSAVPGRGSAPASAGLSRPRALIPPAGIAGVGPPWAGRRGILAVRRRPSAVAIRGRTARLMACSGLMGTAPAVPVATRARAVGRGPLCPCRGGPASIAPPIFPRKTGIARRPGILLPPGIGRSLPAPDRGSSLPARRAAAQRRVDHGRRRFGPLLRPSGDPGAVRLIPLRRPALHWCGRRVYRGGLRAGDLLRGSRARFVGTAPRCGQHQPSEQDDPEGRYATDRFSRAHRSPHRSFGKAHCPVWDAGAGAASSAFVPSGAPGTCPAAGGYAPHGPGA